MTTASGVQRSGKSSTTSLQIVEEFDSHCDDETEEVPQIEELTDGRDAKDGTGKLASWFKNLFKSKDKDREKGSSKGSSRAASQTQNGQKASSPTTSKPTTPSTRQENTSVNGRLLGRSKSTHAAVAPAPPVTSLRPVPPGKVSIAATTTTEDMTGPASNSANSYGPSAGGDASAMSPAGRSKSVVLKTELQRLRQSQMQHSKSFTELSLKAKVVPKRGNELLIVSPTAPLRMQRAEWSLKDYAVVEKMYKGYASSVYKAFCKRSGELVCLKAYDMAALCELNRFQIYREVQLHGKLAHQNVIGLYGAFQVDSQVVMVQEFADGGDLFTLLHRYGGRMPERQAVEMVLQPCLRVLLYLHEQGILHRDLKPENILFTRNMTFKLCDFGLAIDLRDERAVTRAGTLEYMAPEVLECPFKSRPIDNKEIERLHYTAAVDAWAVGVLAYELLVGRPPFEAPEREGVENCIRRQMPRFPFGLSELARSFIATALQKDPAQRPTVSEMIAHPFIRGSRDAATASNLHARAAAAATATRDLTAGPTSPGGAAVVTSGQAQPPRPTGSATTAVVAGGGAAAAAAGGLLPTNKAAPQKKSAASRAIAAAGGMDEDDLGIGAMAGRMKSYTAGKAIAISHQALQANRHVHLPHAADDPASAGAGGAGALGPRPTDSSSGGGLAGSGGAQASGGILAARGGERPAGEHLTPVPPSGPKLSALNPKLAAALGGASGPGLVGRTASVSRLM